MLSNSTRAERLKRSRNIPTGHAKRDKVRLKRGLFRGNRNCVWCGQSLSLSPHSENFATLGHIVPLAVGGTHEKINLALAHARCNRRVARAQIDIMRQIKSGMV